MAVPLNVAEVMLGDPDSDGEPDKEGEPDNDGEPDKVGDPVTVWLCAVPVKVG